MAKRKATASRKKRPAKKVAAKKAAKKAAKRRGADSRTEAHVDAPPDGFVPDPTDREMAIRAMRKRKAGEQPTRAETNALQRESIRRSVRAIPQKIWREMSGRQAKVINEQAERYGLPFGGATVDLYALAPALHNFLSRNKYRLSGQDGDPLMEGDVSPSLERYRDERARMARLDRLEREGVLVSRADLRDGWLLVAGVIRRAAETLQRQFGSDAHEILSDALDEAERMVTESLSEGSST